MRHTVHLYAVVRVAVRGIEAEDHKQAMEIAENLVDLNSLFSLADANGDMGNVEYADEIDSYMVDEADDSDYQKTRNYNKHKEVVLGFDMTEVQS